jgi:hypothetical protein
MPFRDAYRHVKTHLAELRAADPARAVAAKRHLGAPGGLDWGALGRRAHDVERFAAGKRKRYHAAISRLLGVAYPKLESKGGG